MFTCQWENIPFLFACDAIRASMSMMLKLPIKKGVGSLYDFSHNTTTVIYK